MSGNCTSCAKQYTCKKDIGFMFGFCNTDFEPIQTEKTLNTDFFEKEKENGFTWEMHYNGKTWKLD